VKKLVLLFVVLLSGAPLLAAEDISEPPAASMPSAGVPWSSLDSGQRQLLAQFESRWSELPPQRQFALSRGAARWARMDAGEKERATDRFRRWRDLGDERRALIRDRWNDFQNLSPGEQERIRRDFRDYQRLSAARRADLRKQWQQKSRGERQQLLRDLRERRRDRRQAL